MFSKCLRDAQDKNVLVVRKWLAHLLVEIFDFSELFAQYIPDHLDHLNKGSINLLHNLKSDDFDLVHYSTVVEITDEKDKNTLDNNINILKQRAGPRRLNIL